MNVEAFPNKINENKSYNTIAILGGRFSGKKTILNRFFLTEGKIYSTNYSLIKEFEYFLVEKPLWEKYKDYVDLVFNKDKPLYTIVLKKVVVEKYDSYYHQHGDTNYTGTIKCDSGQIDASGNYILSCYLDYSQGQANKITLSKNSNNTYKFLSSVCVKNCDKDY